VEELDKRKVPRMPDSAKKEQAEEELEDKA